MRPGFGLELREILALRGALFWLPVVIGAAGLLALRVDEWHGCARGFKCQTDGLLGEIAGVAPVDCVACETGRLDFGGVVAIPGNDGAEVVDDGIATQGQLLVVVGSSS